MKRSNINLSHDVKTTFDMGQLVPIGCVDVVPGDTFDHEAKALLRVSPLLAPVYHKVDVDILHFFVPNRIIMDNWEDFITGGEDGLDNTVAPYITVPGGGFAVGSLADHLGVPPLKGATEQINALPFRAYAKIYNEWFRDQDIIAPLTIDTGSGSDTTTNTTLQYGAWRKDYFTSARVYPQKGPAITIPLTGDAPVVLNSTTGISPTMRKASDHTILTGGALQSENVSGDLQGAVSNTDAVLDPNGTLDTDLSSVTAVSIADLRLASALQIYEENNARGNRYNEMLLHRWGVRSSDARLQIPEFLGGGREAIQFSEVLNTNGANASAALSAANMRGHGIATMRSNRYRRFFEEHGWVISLMIVRPVATYADGLHRSWSRPTKEDYLTPELQLIGNQEVLNKEVDLANASPSNTFGYQYRYDEYRSHPSRIANEFRTTLNYWTMARIFASPPALNSTFITCTPTDRIYSVTTTSELLVVCNNSIRAKRVIVKNPKPRLM